MTHSKVTILIVDDNIGFVTRMKSYLTEMDNIGMIHTAHSFDEASALLINKPDLVLLDIQLPGKNGMKLLKRIKDSTTDCSVVMLSNHADEYYRDHCIKMGATSFLDKTNDFELVPAIINDWKTSGERVHAILV